MSSTVNDGVFVTPGDKIGLSGDAGAGVVEQNGELVATQIGFATATEGSVCIRSTTPDEPRMPEIGDVIIGQVNRLQTKTAEIRILHVEGKPIRDMPAEQLFGDLFVAEVVNRFMPAPGDAMRLNDLVRAEVLKTKPIIKLTTKPKPRYGVLHAACPACGEKLTPSDKVDDFNVACGRCDYSAFRALADDYGHGFFEEGSGFDALNRGGERWNSDAEARLSHDGSRPYLSLLADYRRGSTHEIPKQYLSRSGGGDHRGGGRGGGRPQREMHKTTCTLCSDKCEVPFKPTPGKPIRCRPCMEKIENSDATPDELAAERKVLLAARDAAQETAGFKMFIGGLPYETTEEELTELFVEHGKLKEVHIATDRETGKSKGFAFVTYETYTVGKKALPSLKSLKIGGRKLTVQEAKSGGGGGRGGRGGGGGHRGGGGGNRHGGRSGGGGGGNRGSRNDRR
jgi:CxxC-x17-CxxC domain-containing protein